MSGIVKAISLHQLKKRYARGWKQEGVTALDGVSLDVSMGEAFGFIGPNGAGKSTTIKILTGAIRQGSGEACLFGVPASEPRARIGLGYVPESPYLYDYLTPLETLRMGLKLHHIRESGPDEYCISWLKKLGLDAVARQSVRQFSKGMTQRLAIAQALSIRPKLLILDEPLSGLDPIGRRDVVDLLSEYKQGGGTLFFTSHVLHDVERLADRFGLINRGLLQAVRSPAELSGSDEMMTVRTTGTLPVAGLREDFTGRWIGEIPRSALWQCLREIQSSGHQLIEVRPTLSLETAFLNAVDKKDYRSE